MNPDFTDMTKEMPSFSKQSVRNFRSFVERGRISYSGMKFSSKFSFPFSRQMTIEMPTLLTKDVKISPHCVE